jgi:hypothetical protein
MSDQTIPPLSAAELAALAKRHVEATDDPNGVLVRSGTCFDCHEYWPCDAAKAIQAAQQGNKAIRTMLDTRARALADMDAMQAERDRALETAVALESEVARLKDDADNIATLFERAVFAYGASQRRLERTQPVIAIARRLTGRHGESVTPFADDIVALREALRELDGES